MPVPEHLHKARAFLQDAQLCVDHGRYDSAVSRAYYAMFRAAIALLEHYGDVRPGWNHGRLATILRERMVQTRALLESRDVQELENAYASRLIADYRDRRLSSQESRTVLEAANRFVAKIEGVINHGTHP
jgi:uncharacterized protein (UPF0332 family)